MAHKNVEKMGMMAVTKTAGRFSGGNIQERKYKRSEKMGMMAVTKTAGRFSGGNIQERKYKNAGKYISKIKVR